jgi:putative DNA primase/helicase
MANSEPNPKKDIETIEESAKGQPPKKEDTTELINAIARDLIASGKYRTFKDNEQVYHYKDGIYNRNGETAIKQTIHEMQDGKESTNMCNEIIGKVQRGTYTDRELFIEHDQHKIVLKNGILDLDSLELTDHTPEWLSLTKFPVKYNREAKCPGILKFISEIVRPEDIPLLQEWAGYNLWVFGYPSQKAILLVGDGGNGKSTFIGILESMIGRQNRSAVSLHELEENRFAKADLFGKASNLYPDLPNRDLKSTGMFKMLTGGDPIRAEDKNIKAFTFHNFAKLTFSCNEVPRVPEDSTAFFRRWIIVEFPHSFEGTNKEDRDLKEKLTTDEIEMSGFLNWALEGLKRLRSNGWKFSNSKTVDTVKEDYIVRSDPYKAFVMHCIIEDSNSQTKKDDLYTAYREHCEIHKVTSRSRDSFFKNFKDNFKPGSLEDYRPNKDEDPDRPRMFKGIRIRAKEMWCKPMDDTEFLDGHGVQQGGLSGLSGLSESNESNESRVSPPLSVSVVGSENDTENKENPDKSDVQNKNSVDGEDSITLENGEMIKDQLLKLEYLISPDSGPDMFRNYYKIGILGMDRLPDKKKQQLEGFFQTERFTNQHTGAMGITWFSRPLKKEVSE